MPYNCHVSQCNNTTHFGERAEGKTRLHDYDDKPDNKWHNTSVYSAHAVRELVRSFGVCCSCHRDADLVNDYCADCRTLGANEAEVMGMAHSSETGRKNSANSSWRMK